MQAPAQNSPEISGQVIDNSSKQPLAGARVALVQFGPGRSVPNDIFSKFESYADGEKGVQPATTGEDGRFHFPVKVGGQYALKVRREGYTNYGDAVARTYSIQAGEPLPQVVVGLDRPSSISGKVVDRETGEPLAGWSVLAWYWRVESGSRNLLPGSSVGGRTDKDGHYEIRDLPAGEYVLSCFRRSNPFQPAGTAEQFRDGGVPTYLASYYPGVEREEEALVTTVLAGSVLENVDLKLTKRRAAAIRGCVHADDKVTLTLFEWRVRGSMRSTSMVAGQSVAPDGCFRMEGLRAGHYVLTAEANTKDPARRQVARVALDLDGNRVDGLDLHLRAGASLAGRLRMRESAEAPLPKRTQMLVRLSRRDGAGVNGEDLSGGTASDGTFVLRGLTDGRYKVEGLRAPDGFKVGEVLYNGTHARGGVFAFEPGALDQKLELVLHPATATIQISVEGGTQAAGARLVLLPEERDGDDPQQDARETTADGNGRGAFSPLLAGKYRVFAFAPDLAWRTDAAFARQAVSGVEVELNAGNSRSVEVKVSRLE
jgi:hypothetical protein